MAFHTQGCFATGNKTTRTIAMNNRTITLETLIKLVIRGTCILFLNTWTLITLIVNCCSGNNHYSYRRSAITSVHVLQINIYGLLKKIEWWEINGNCCTLNSLSSSTCIIIRYIPLAQTLFLERYNFERNNCSQKRKMQCKNI